MGTRQVTMTKLTCLAFVLLTINYTCGTKECDSVSCDRVRCGSGLQCVVFQPHCVTTPCCKMTQCRHTNHTEQHNHYQHDHAHHTDDDLAHHTEEMNIHGNDTSHAMTTKPLHLIYLLPITCIKLNFISSMWREV